MPPAALVPTADEDFFVFPIAYGGAGGENAERTKEMWKDIPARSKNSQRTRKQ